MAGHRGRQPDVPGGRGFVHQVKVTGDQERRLRQLAAVQGVTVARLLVESTLSRDGWSPAQRRTLGAELLGVRRTLSGIGTNVNQLAAWANSERRWPVQAAGTLGVIEQAIARLEAVVEDLART